MFTNKIKTKLFLGGNYFLLYKSSFFGTHRSRQEQRTVSSFGLFGTGKFTFIVISGIVPLTNSGLSFLGVRLPVAS